MRPDFLAFCFFLLVLIYPYYISAQINDSLLIKAWMYYEFEEHEMALPLVLKYLETENCDLEALKLAGNCYLEAGNFELSLKYYKKALSLDSTYSDVYYNLGNLYDQSDISDSALFFFRKYNNLEPYDIKGYLRVAALMIDRGQLDEALHHAEIAAFIEPRNSYAKYMLGMVYFAMGNYSESFKVADEAINNGITHNTLYQLRGLSLFYQSEYDKAFIDFSYALDLFPGNIGLIEMKAQSLLIKNTDPDQISMDKSGEIRFTKYSSNDLITIRKELSRPVSSYFYDKLYRKFIIDPFNFGLNDFLMLYIGFTFKPEYSPYRHNDDEVARNFEEGLYERVLETALKQLESNPTLFRNYWYIANSYAGIGDYANYYANIFKYYGFLESVKATGDGRDARNAYIITDARHAYPVFYSFGYKLESQILLHEDNKPFEVLSGTDRYGDHVKIYFNNELPFSTLNFKNNERKRRRSK